MGLLDDLKQQAEARKRQLAEPAARDRTRRAVDALLREVSHYFTELADALNVVQPPVARHFHIFQARLDGLLQCDYNARERRTAVSDGGDRRPRYNRAWSRKAGAGLRDTLTKR